MADCSQCKRLKRQDLLQYSLTCKGFEYYEPRDITFCPHQIKWLIKSIALLHEFKWPRGYNGFQMPKRKRPGGGGYFETPADYAFEIERRLEYCCLDGLLVLLYYGFDFEATELAKYYRLNLIELEKRIEAVVWRISGWNFYPENPYRRWLVYRDYEVWLTKIKSMPALA
jgi:hypothetical protein